MSVVIVLLAALLPAVPPQHVESRLVFPGELGDFEVLDVDGDGRNDVLLVGVEQGRRVLLLHRQRERGAFQGAADWRLSVPADVVSYAFMDVRDEPGTELLLLTSGAVFSVSTADRGLKDNLRRELVTPLFPELAAPRELPRWRWVLDLDGDGRDQLLLLSGGALVPFDRAVDAEGVPLWTAGPALPARQVLPKEREVRAGFRGMRAAFRSERWMSDIFPGLVSSRPLAAASSLLDRSLEWDLPRLLDWDGDGLLDAVLGEEKQLRVFRQRAGTGFLGDDGLVVGLPRQASAGEDLDEDVDLIDLDGDGRAEVVVTSTGEGGLTRDYGVTVYACGADGAPATEACGRVKLSGSHVRFRFHDVDRDGRLDLVARVVELPGGIQSLAATRIDLKLLLFLGRGGTAGQDGPGFSRHPDARYEKRMAPDRLERIRESFLLELAGDFDGDGLGDLLVLRDDGLLQIQPLEKRGLGLRFSEQPLAVRKPAQPVRQAHVVDLSADGVADLILEHEDGLTILVSVDPARAGGR